MERARQINIERTWSGMVGGSLSRSDYMADRMVAMLDELEEALKMPRADFAAREYETAGEIYARWDQPIIKHTERDAMFRELGQAITSLYGAPFAASYGISEKPERLGWADNVYRVGQGSMIKVPLEGRQMREVNKRGAVKKIEDLISSRARYLRIAGMEMNRAMADALARNDRVRTLVLIDCTYPQGWANPFPFMSLRRLMIYGGHGSQPPEDRFNWMQRSGIDTLELVMADFMLEAECMASVRNMTSLAILNVCRTLTTEKVRNRGANLQALIGVLLDAIRVCQLRELNIAACSAISIDDIKQLARALASNNGRLIVGGETQLKLLGVGK